MSRTFWRVLPSNETKKGTLSRSFFMFSSNSFVQLLFLYNQGQQAHYTFPSIFDGVGRAASSKNGVARTYLHRGSVIPHCPCAFHDIIQLRFTTVDMFPDGITRIKFQYGRKTPLRRIALGRQMPAINRTVSAPPGATGFLLHLCRFDYHRNPPLLCQTCQ